MDLNLVYLAATAVFGLWILSNAGVPRYAPVKRRK